MFVLGATKAGQLRVKDFGGLVYKEGQGGVNRAAVTIVFSNTDPATSPAGFEDMPSFTVTRTVKHGDGSSKYLINGAAAQQSRVHALFHSVQLNIDNPTFLVQQGQITKVVNMKARDVLAMLEEATGVRLYEEQKAKALKVLTQKQSKVDEMDKILREEITPTLEKRRAESEQYQRWQRNMQEVDRKKRVLVAFTYWNQSKLLEQSKDMEAELERESTQLRDATKAIQNQLAEIKQHLEALVQQKAQEMGQEFREVEQEESAASKSLIQFESEWKHQSKMLKEERDQMDSLTKSIADLCTSIEKKRSGQATAVADFDVLTQELQQLQQQVVLLGQRMEAAEAGVATGANDASGSLTDQVMVAKQTQSKSRTLAKQLAMQLKSLQKEFAEKKAQASAAGAEAEDANRRLSALTKERDAIQKRIDGMGFDPSRRQALLQEHESLIVRIKQLSSQIETLASKSTAGYDYRYQFPHKGFDSQKVLGRFGKLIKVRDPEACTALEVVAGAKLRNVVIDSEATGRDLLKANTRDRVTFIPLDQIRSEPIVSKAEKAKQLVGPENADLATRFVDYDPAVKPAVDFVFGRSIICKENAHATQIAFNQDPNVVAHCVTYDGDVFDPSGTLTGGSKGAMGQTLKVLSEVQGLEKELKQCRARLQEVESELRSLEDKARQYGEVSRELQLKEHELKLLGEKMQSSSSHQLVVRVNELSSSIERDTKLLANAEKEEQDATAKVQELEQMIKEFSKTKDHQIKEMKKEITANKKKQETLKGRLSSARDAKDTLVAEVAALEEEKATLESQLNMSRLTVNNLEGEVEKARAAVDKAKARCDKARADLSKKKALLERCDKEMSRVSERQNELTSALAEENVKAKQLEHKMQRFNKDLNGARSVVDRLVAEHDWIKTESQFFGKAHTDYDFSRFDVKVAEAELAKLVNEQQRLEGKINKKVASMISEADRKYNEVQERKTIVERDKEQILSTIDELDRKKVEALEKTYEQVNADFGKLYSKFLPGATAVLSKVDNDILNGLEIRVCFGTVWKDSLTELSGGQRSLMALSLILALCRYKAAPLYILDEIDSALDNSHTENIGDIIGQEFSSSQFIVVSLKEGFYRNCNTLFEVELDETIQSSKVTRTARTKVAGKKK